MWRDEVLALVAARSAPGALAATFTVAGAVRRGLAAAGFTVEKQPGFGRKRQRLEARLPGESAPFAPPPRGAVIGAGMCWAPASRGPRGPGVEPPVPGGVAARARGAGPGQGAGGGGGGGPEGAVLGPGAGGRGGADPGGGRRPARRGGAGDPGRGRGALGPRPAPAPCAGPGELGRGGVGARHGLG